MVNKMKNNNKISFKNEKLPYTIKAQDERYIIATRKLNKRQDADLLKHKVNMNAYNSFNEAYNDLKSEVIYTIVDLKEQIRSTDDYIFGIYDYSSQFDIDQCLIDLNSGECRLSKRNMITLEIDLK